MICSPLSVQCFYEKEGGGGKEMDKLNLHKQEIYRLYRVALGWGGGGEVDSWELSQAAVFTIKPRGCVKYTWYLLETLTFIHITNFRINYSMRLHSEYFYNYKVS